MVASYVTDLDTLGTVNWTLSGNYNETKITKLGVAPAALGGIALFDRGAQSNIETASPKVKLIGSAFYTIGKVSATFRGTMYGKSSAFYSPDGRTFYKQRIGTAYIQDVELNYKLTKELEISIGANNLFDERPPIVALVPGTTNATLVNGGNVLDAPLTFSPYGINGGYYYGRINVSL